MKKFLPLDKLTSLPEQVAMFLLQDAGDGLVDFGDTMVIVPTAGAERAIRRQLAKRGVLSPLFRLPMEALLLDESCVATRLEREAAWAMVLDPAARRKFQALVPEPVKLAIADDRFGVASHLCSVCDQLAEVGLTPASPELTTLFENDAQRWEAFGKLYGDYLDALTRFELHDPNARRIALVANPEVPVSLRRVVVACVVDLPVIVENYLEALSQKGVAVEVLAWSPAGQIEHLDDWGRPNVAWWGENLPRVDDAVIVAENDPASEAGVLLDRAADAVEGNFALFSAAPESSVALAAEITLRKEQAYLPDGRSLGQTECVAIWQGWGKFSRSNSLRDLRHLLQCPAFLTWYVKQANGMLTPDGALEVCDIFITEKLCETVRAARSFLQNTAKQTPAFFNTFLGVIEEALLQKISAKDFLIFVFEASGMVPPDSARGRELAGMAEVFHQVEKSPIISTLSEELREAALRAEMGRHRIFTPAAEGDIEIRGWLEAPWSTSGLNIIAGCREGALPSGMTEDAFLPDSAKKKLGIMDGEKRFARDALLLSCLLSTKARSLLGFCRFRSQGEPNRPSRLLFGGDDDALPQRVALLLRSTLPAVRKGRDAALWQLHLPRLSTSSIDSLRVTGFKTYLQCPLRFYLKNICRLSPFDPQAREMNAADFGTVMHKVLEEYGTHTEDDPAKIASILEVQLEEVACRFFGNEISPVVRVQLEAMRERLRAFAQVQAQTRHEGWRIIATEQAIKKEDKVMLGPLRLTGTMDRVEIHEADRKLRILDYKTFGKAKSPASTHLITKREREDVPSAHVMYNGKATTWKDLQLPLYRYLVPHFFKEYRDFEIEVGYVLLPSDVENTSLAMLPLNEEEWNSAIACATEIAELVHRGVFWPPSTRVEYDDFVDWFRWGNPQEMVSEESQEFLRGRL